MSLQTSKPPNLQTSKPLNRSLFLNARKFDGLEKKIDLRRIIDWEILSAPNIARRTCPVLDTGASDTFTRPQVFFCYAPDLASTGSYVVNSYKPRQVREEATVVDGSGTVDKPG